jgi:hypothetical protein
MITSQCLFHAAKANEWLVSKLFFQAAARALVGVQAFGYGDPAPAEIFDRSACDLIIDQKGVFGDFATSARIAARDLVSDRKMNLLLGCRTLKRLETLVAQDSDWYCDGIYPWTRLMNDHEIKHMIPQAWTKLHGLEEFKLLAIPGARRRTEQGKQFLQANLLQMEQFVRSHTNRERLPLLPTFDSNMLYPGSHVSFGQRRVAIELFGSLMSRAHGDNALSAELDPREDDLGHDQDSIKDVVQQARAEPKSVVRESSSETGKYSSASGLLRQLAGELRADAARLRGSEYIELPTRLEPQACGDDIGRRQSIGQPP